MQEVHLPRKAKGSSIHGESFPTERQQQWSSDENDALDALLRISPDDTQELQLSNIPHLLMELFVGGIDTTSSTIEWAMTELLRSPNKMNEARRELELVVGKGVTAKEEDFPRLPYLQAIIKETLRMHGSDLFHLYPEE